jgi:hypothetical protein
LGDDRSTSCGVCPNYARAPVIKNGRCESYILIPKAAREMEATLDLEDMVRVMRNLGAIGRTCQDLSEIAESIRMDVAKSDYRILGQKVNAMTTLLLQIDQSRKVISRTLGTWD